MWQISPKVIVGPIRDWRGRVMPVPHHVASPPLNHIRCPVKLMLLRSEKCQCQCLSLTPSFSLPPFVSFTLPPALPHALFWGRPLQQQQPPWQKPAYATVQALYFTEDYTASTDSLPSLTGESGWGGVDHDQRGRSGQMVACGWVTLDLIGGGFQRRVRLREEEEMGGRWGGGKRFPLLLFHNEAALRALTQLAGPTATWLRGWTGPGPIAPALIEEKKKNTEEEGRLHRLTLCDWNCWHQQLWTYSSVFFQYKQWLIVCSTEWTALVYLKSQQSSWMASTNRAQRGLRCRGLPKERPAAPGGQRTGSHVPQCNFPNNHKNSQ